MRFLRALLGAFLGLALAAVTAWLCAYTLQDVHFSHAAPPSTGGCSDDEHCGSKWAIAWDLASVFLPIIACGVAAFMAAFLRWSRKRSVVVLGVLFAINLIVMASRYVPMGF